LPPHNRIVFTGKMADKIPHLGLAAQSRPLRKEPDAAIAR
jgi:hypothetical protein